MVESAAWSKLRMFFQQPDGGFHGVQVTVGDFPAGIQRIPLELLLDVGDECIRFVDGDLL